MQTLLSIRHSMKIEESLMQNMKRCPYGFYGAMRPGLSAPVGSSPSRDVRRWVNSRVDSATSASVHTVGCGARDGGRPARRGSRFCTHIRVQNFNGTMDAIPRTASHSGAQGRGVRVVRRSVITSGRMASSSSRPSSRTVSRPRPSCLEPQAAVESLRRCVASFVLTPIEKHL